MRQAAAREADRLLYRAVLLLMSSLGFLDTSTVFFYRLKTGETIMSRLPIRWGISLPNRGALFGLTNVDELIETAKLAEQSGVFESVWFGDSLIHKPRLEAITMLAAVATHTKKVRLGTICMASFPVRHPVLLAIQWASLDQISKGTSASGRLHRRRPMKAS